MGRNTTPVRLIRDFYIPDPYREDHHAELLNKARDKYHDPEGSLIVVVDGKFIIARTTDLVHAKKIAAACKKYHMITEAARVKVSIYSSNPTPVK